MLLKAYITYARPKLEFATIEPFGILVLKQDVTMD